MEKTSEKFKQTNAVSETTGRRWCNQHQGHAPVADGQFVMRGKTKSWMCNACIAIRRKH